MAILQTKGCHHGGCNVHIIKTIEVITINQSRAYIVSIDEIDTGMAFRIQRLRAWPYQSIENISTKG